MNRALTLSACCLLALTGCTVLPPLTPEAPTGPESGLVGTSYRFTAVTTDPQGLPLSYKFDWGDGSASEWTGCVPSGTPLTVTHAWEQAGRFPVFVQARNARGRISELSPAHWISVAGLSGYPDSVIATIPVGGDPTELAFLPDGSRIYVGNEVYGYVKVIDVALRSVTATLDLGGMPYLMAVKPGGEYVYVVNGTMEAVQVVRTSDNAVVATVPVGSSPARCCFSPDGARCYVTNQDDNSISVIRTSDNAVVATIPVGNTPRDIDCLPNGEYLYTANLYGDDVTVIRASDNTVVATIPMPFAVHRVRVLPGSEYVYVNEYHGNGVVKVRTRDNTIVDRFDCAGALCGMTTVNDGDYLYISCMYNSGTAAVVRTADDTVVAYIRTGNRPMAAHSPLNGEMVATCDRDSHTVTIIGRR